MSKKKKPIKKLTPENQKYLDRYKDAVDDAGPGATQQQINERMGV